MESSDPGRTEGSYKSSEVRNSQIGLRTGIRMADIHNTKKKRDKHINKSTNKQTNDLDITAEVQQTAHILQRSSKKLGSSSELLKSLNFQISSTLNDYIRFWDILLLDFFCNKSLLRQTVKHKY
jgi:hypothetical protein